jgi:hypothetical protein
MGMAGTGTTEIPGIETLDQEMSVAGVIAVITGTRVVLVDVMIVIVITAGTIGTQGDNRGKNGING